MHWLKFFLAWVVGTIIAALTMSLWLGQGIDWKQVIISIVGGLGGILIVAGVRKFKKE